MEWVKNNLQLVIGGAVALALLAGAGYYFYSRFAAEKEVESELASARDNLNMLLTQNPFPDEENIVRVKADQKRVQEFLRQAEQYFRPMQSEPVSNSADFAAYLQRTLYRLERAAKEASVTLPTNFAFGFNAQKQLLQVDTNSLSLLTIQLSDIDTLCGLLFQSRVYELMGVKRAAVSTNDQAALTEYPQDYLSSRQVSTNETVRAMASPYELTFRCSSPELAGVLEAVARAPHGILVKAVRVEPADAEPTEEGMDYRMPEGRGIPAERSNFLMMRRYGLTEARRPPPPPMPTPGMGPTPSQRPKANVLVSERPLRVSLLVHVVRFIPGNPEPAAAPQMAAAPQ